MHTNITGKVTMKTPLSKLNKGDFFTGDRNRVYIYTGYNDQGVYTALGLDIGSTIQSFAAVSFYADFEVTKVPSDKVTINIEL